MEMNKIKIYAVRKSEKCFAIVKDFPEDILDGWFGPMYIEEKDYSVYKNLCCFLEGSYQVIHNEKIIKKQKEER